MTTIVLFQVFYLLECRSLRHSILHVGLWTNPWALAGIAGVLALQVAFIYAPPMQDVFGSAPLERRGLAAGARRRGHRAARRRRREVVAPAGP